MPRKSVKADKSLYQVVREEELGLTRAQASELLGGLSESQIEKIENGKTPATPDDVMLMAKGYKKPELCNYFCSKECPIGQKYVPEVKAKELPQIVLEMIASLNTLNKQKDRLIEITADGVISNDEMADFSRIKHQLSQIARTADSLQLWIENTIAAGGLDAEALK